MAEVVGRELAWDDQIEKDSEYVLLPEGDYNFEVTEFERARHSGSAKLPACNKAVLTIRLWDESNESYLKHNLFLHTSTEGLLCAFFTSIGQRQKGEKITMNWGQVIGSQGRCKVGVREWTNDKGEKKQSNEINRFYEKEDAPAAAQQPQQQQPGWRF